MKSCPKCKTQFTDDKNFCKSCGIPLVIENELNPKFLARKLVFEDKLKVDPLNISLLFDYATFLYENSLFNEANLYLYKILTIQDNNREAQELLFHSFTKQGKDEEAFEISKKLLQTNPNDISLLIGNGELAQKIGNYTLAIEYYNRVKTIDSYNEIASKNKAVAFLKLGNEDEAMKAWEEVYKFDSTDITAQLFVGIKFALNNEFEKSRDLLESIENKVTDHSHEQYLEFLFLAYSYCKLKIKPEIISKFYKKIVDNFKNEKILFRDRTLLSEIANYLGFLALDKNDFNSAINYFNSLEGLCNFELGKLGLGKTYYQMGVAEFTAKNYENSLNFLTKSLSFIPNYNDAKIKHEEIINTIKIKKSKQKKTIVIICSIIIITIVSAFFIIIFINYQKEKSSWGEVKKTNTSISYQYYLNNYPNGRYIKEATQLQEEALWNEVQKENSIEGYNKFISLYGKSKHINEAYEKKEDASWIVAKMLNDYRNYILQYPNGKFTNIAMQYLKQSGKAEDNLNKNAKIIEFQTQNSKVQFTKDDNKQLATNIIFQDNFNDNSINMNFWNVRGSDAYEQEGILKLEQKVTDHGPSLNTKMISFNPLEPILISRKLNVHYANEYYYGHMTITFNDETTISIYYLHAIWINDRNIPLKDGIYMFIAPSDALSTYSPPSGGSSSEYKLTKNIWNTWFNEVVKINPRTGKIQYLINDNLISEVQTNLSFSNKSALKISFSPAGWYTGHYQYFDDLIITN